MLELGARVRDTITGFEGILVSRIQWLNGCTRLGIQSTRVKDVPLEVQYFDEPQVCLVEPKAVQTRPGSTGGPMPVPARHPDPVRR